MKFTLRSASCCSFKPLPEMPNWRIGTLEALKLMISGGRVPGGSWRRTNCDAAVICAFAVSRLAPGCRKTLTTATPLYVVDSVCSMLSTSVVSTFSYGVVSRPSISSGFNPVYCQAMATTGILMFGKMSVGVLMITTGLMIRIRSAMMMNVYGRSSANFTIHTSRRPFHMPRPSEKPLHYKWMHGPRRRMALLFR